MEQSKTFRKRHVGGFDLIVINETPGGESPGEIVGGNWKCRGKMDVIKECQSHYLQHLQQHNYNIGAEMGFHME